MKHFFVVAATILLSAQAVSAAEKTYIVGFHEKPGHTEKRLIEGHKGKIKKALDVLPVVIADLGEEDAAALLQDNRISYVEESVTYSLPVEPYATSTEYVDSWGVSRIGAEAVHQRGITGLGVKVGIIDSGIDFTNPELAPNYKGGYDCVFTDDIPDDENGHGTHVAGILAAKGNGSGFVGVAPDVDIYAIRVLDGGGFGSSAWLMCGLDQALKMGVQVLNISNGTSLNSVALQDAVQQVYAAGIVVVAAVGNGSRDLTLGPTYPACYPTVIGVTATDAADVVASFANYGPNVELAAPGVNINSTYKAGTTRVMSGTSQAAPHVAGAAALLLSAGVQDKDGNGNLVDEVRSILDSTAIELGAPGRDVNYGYGLVDVSWLGVTPPPEMFNLAGGAAVPIARTLPAGSYSITITNQNISRVDIARSLVKNRTWPMTIRFSGRSPQTVTLDVVIAAADETFSFTPYGKKGTSAVITIRKK